MSPERRREPLVVIGAGPVGSLLALALARRGYAVEVFERRPDMRKADIGGGRSINLAVSTRGIHALHGVGLERAVLDHALPMRGRMTHALDGQLSFLRYGRDDSEAINSMSRGGLNKLLMSAAEATGRAHIHFNQRLVGHDFAHGEAILRDEVTRVERRVAAPVMFGTDGSASCLRAAIVTATQGPCREDELDFGYKELTLPARPGGGYGGDGKFALPPNGLHIWPRGQFMLIALPNLDGTFTCTLFLPFQPRRGTPSFVELRDERAVADVFQRWFPDAAPLFPDLARQFLDAPLGHMVTVRTWPWTHDSALLLGDAAHAVVPFFGQGMNAGFEDCSELAARIDTAPPQTQDDWQALMAAFATGRKPDADAIADLALENFVEMRDKVADPAFLLQREVELDLQRRIGPAYRTRYQLVTFTRVPYRAALAVGRVQDAVLREACAGKVVLADVDLVEAEAAMRARVLPELARLGV
jgi:kynurenine 3-monooxygenase